jgi:hypothetical protein
MYGLQAAMKGPQAATICGVRPTGRYEIRWCFHEGERAGPVNYAMNAEITSLFYARVAVITSFIVPLFHRTRNKAFYGTRKNFQPESAALVAAHPQTQGPPV